MKTLLLALLMLPLVGQAAPEINIGTLYDYLDGSKSTLLKRVRNGGDATAFVKVSVVELVYDASGKPTEVAMDGLGVAERALVASPARLIVPANGLQSVRLLYRGERVKERYFRLRFIPVLPQARDGFAITDAEAEHYEDSLKAGVNILAGYGSLLFVRPAKAHFATEVEHEPGRFIVRNSGNATVVLDHFNDCDTTGKQCETATKHHVLPNGNRAFDKKAGRTYRFELIEGDKHRQIELKG